jgi:hypothetical protein
MAARTSRRNNEILVDFDAVSGIQLGASYENSTDWRVEISWGPGCRPQPPASICRPGATTMDNVEALLTSAGMT